MATIYELPKLPWEDNALDPYISSNTIGFHYGKHHQGYVTKYNAAIEGTEYADQPLEQVIQNTYGKADKKGIYNNAAQIWNHTFYWHSLSPKGGQAPTGRVKDAIEKSFGSYEEFKTKFAAQAGSLFGSGWTWLVQNGSQLEIVQTSNADTPLTDSNQKALMTLDVWEHAYYLDYQNKRPEYIDVFLDKLVNWEFVNQNLG
ncbi:MAG: superoxide dismutase [Bdellovibrionales bacterium]|nr:superoxide dismutase [Bdellovibrionales bacterium]